MNDCCIQAMRAIMTNLRSRGGQGELHSWFFPRFTKSDYMSALYRLRMNGRIRLVAPCTYEVVE